VYAPGRESVETNHWAADGELSQQVREMAMARPRQFSPVSKLLLVLLMSLGLWALLFEVVCGW
jgi:hypothetical protein